MYSLKTTEIIGTLVGRYLNYGKVIIYYLNCRYQTVRINDYFSKSLPIS